MERSPELVVTCPRLAEAARGGAITSQTADRASFGFVERYERMFCRERLDVGKAATLYPSVAPRSSRLLVILGPVKKNGMFGSKSLPFADLLVEAEVAAGAGAPAVVIGEGRCQMLPEVL